jgi:hypothetical protein
MRKAFALILLLLIGLPILLFAQEDDNPAVEPDWEIYTADVYTRGDQTFNISLGTVFPTVFVNQGKKIPHNFKPPVGGTGSLSYNYFLYSLIFVGGEVGGLFMSTIGENTIFIIPLGARGGYQFIYERFEFPLSLSLGMTWHRYLNLAHYSFYMKGGGSAYFRFNTDWSFGLNTYWIWLPEWTGDRKTNVDGNIIELTLSARYHF